MVVHVFYMNGLRNRALVISQWAFSYFTFGRGVRLITGVQPKALEEKS